MIDFRDDEEEVKERREVPDGQYNVVIDKCEEREYAGEKQISVRFRITEGAYKDENIYYNIRKSRDNPNEYDRFSIKKLVVFGQGWTKEKNDELEKKGVYVHFTDYPALIQYLNSGIEMNVDIKYEYDKQGNRYKYPTIKNFAPKAVNTNIKGASAATDDSLDSEDLPF